RPEWVTGLGSEVIHLRPRPRRRLGPCPARGQGCGVFPGTVCAPPSPRTPGDIASPAPAVPQGINAGVSTEPCGVAIRPRRAGPDWAWMVKRGDTENMVQASPEIPSVPPKSRAKARDPYNYDPLWGSPSPLDLRSNSDLTSFGM